MLNKLRQRSADLLNEIIKGLRPKFEKFVSNSEPAVIIMISVIAVVYTTAFAIFLVSLAFGLQDMLIQEVKYILITPLLPFATVVFLAVMEKLWIVTTTRVMPRFIKSIDNFVERIENHAEHTKNRKEPRESHIERMAKKFDDETLDLIFNKSQLYSIAMWLQVAACVMAVLLAMNTHYDGDVKKAALRFVLPITIEVLGILLLFIHDYFDKVITAKKQLKKLDDQDTSEE